jgi:hypothetical protein
METPPLDELHARLRTHHEQLAAAPGTGSGDLITATLRSTADLLNAEAAQAAHAAEQRRQARARRLRLVCEATAAGLVLQGIAVFAGWITRDWLLLLAPMLIGAGLIWATEQARSARGQTNRLLTACCLAAASVWTAVTAVAGWPTLGTLPGLALLAIAVLAWDGGRPARKETEIS